MLFEQFSKRTAFKDNFVNISTNTYVPEVNFPFEWPVIGRKYWDAGSQEK